MTFYGIVSAYDERKKWGFISGKSGDIFLFRPVKSRDEAA